MCEIETENVNEDFTKAEIFFSTANIQKIQIL